MMSAVVLGMLLGLSVALFLVAVTGRQKTLLAEILAVDNALPQRVAAVSGGTIRDTAQSALTRFVASRPELAALLGVDIGADLRIMGIDATAHLVKKIGLALAVFIVAPPVLGALALVAGWPMITAMSVAIVLGLLAFLVPDGGVRRSAAKRREDFTATMTSYLDLVALRAASGSGVSEALRDASTIGTGYGWRRLRIALQDARFAGMPPSHGLTTLGADLSIPELSELSNQLALIDDTGAQSESTLRAKADALRSAARTQLEGDANSRSATMTIGQVLFAIGFLILLGYPAFIQLAQI